MVGSQEAVRTRIEKSRSKKQQQFRDARSESRRMQTLFGGATGDLVKFNQLMVSRLLLPDLI